MSLVYSKIQNEILKFGLTLETLNVIGIKTPKDVEKLFEKEKERKEYLINQKKNIQQRIKELKDKLNEQQDLLLDDKITQDVYEKKKQQIQVFIDEIKQELRKVDEILNEMSVDASNINNITNNLSIKFKVCKNCGKEIDKEAKICSYCWASLK